MRISILLAMLAFSVPALCHIPFYEPQLLNLDDQDWSLETPFEVPRDEAEGNILEPIQSGKKFSLSLYSATHSDVRPPFLAGWSPSLNTARAYISVVGGEEDPYDVVTFTIGEDEEPQHLGAVVPYITACEATENAFLTVALLGPESERFPAASDEVASTLPFTIPEGYGIIVREEPQVRFMPMPFVFITIYDQCTVVQKLHMLTLGLTLFPLISFSRRQDPCSTNTTLRHCPSPRTASMSQKTSIQRNVGGERH